MLHAGAGHEHATPPELPGILLPVLPDPETIRQVSLGVTPSLFTFPTMMLQSILLLIEFVNSQAPVPGGLVAARFGSPPTPRILLFTMLLLFAPFSLSPSSIR